jgi:hypothetical protein
MRRHLLMGIASLAAVACSGSKNGSSSTGTATNAASSSGSSTHATNSSSASGSTGSHSASTSSGSSASSSASTSTSSTATASGSSSSSSSSSGASSSSASSSSSSSGSTAYATYCASYNAALCSLLGACGYVDPAVSCTVATGGNAYDCSASSSYAFDPTSGAACLALLAAPVAGAGGGLCAFTGLEADGGSPCAWAVQPAVPPGGACNFTDHLSACSPLLDGGIVPCVPMAALCSTVGTCGFLPLGQPCSGNDCADGFCSTGTANPVCTAFLAVGADCTQGFCDATTAFCGLPADGGLTAVCNPILATGAPCSFVGCVGGDYCGAAADGGTVCVTQGTLGESCDPTQFTSCASGLVCANGSCASAFAQAGNPCGPQITCSGSTCSATDGGLGTCVADVGLGQACQLAGAPQCSFPLVCDNGTCAARPTAGNPCPAMSGPSGCIGGDVCVDSQCFLLGALGDPCHGPSTLSGPTCVQGYCDPTGHCAAYVGGGAPCDPALFQCGPITSGTPLSDGGFAVTDGNCLPAEDGGTVCVGTCP